MLSEFGREELGKIKSQQWAAGAKAEDAKERIGIALMPTAVWAVSGSFITWCTLGMTELNKRMPETTEYSTIALGGLVAGLYVGSRVGGDRLLSHIRSYKTYQKRAAVLGEQHQELKTWVDKPSPLKGSDQEVLDTFTNQLESWDGSIEP